MSWVFWVAEIGQGMSDGPRAGSLKVPLGVVRDQSDCWVQDSRPGNQAGTAWQDHIGIRLLRISGPSMRGLKCQDEESDLVFRRHQGATQGF